MFMNIQRNMDLFKINVKGNKRKLKYKVIKNKINKISKFKMAKIKMFNCTMK